MLVKRAVLTFALAVALVASTARAQPAFPDRVDRVVGLARVWAKVKFFHPYLAYKDIDWDGAFVAALPKVEAATTEAQYRAALAGLVAVLHDPVTHVVEPLTKRTADKPPAEWLSWPAPNVLEIKLAGLVGDPRDFSALRANGKRAADDAAKARVLIVDARTPFADDAIDYLTDALPAYDAWPSERTIVHDGYRTQSGEPHTGYDSTFIAPAVAAAHDAPKVGPRHVVFVIDSKLKLPSAALALQASGHATIVADGVLVEDAIVSATDVDLGGGVVVHVRLGESLWGLPIADAIGKPAELEARAIAIAKKTTWPRAGRRPAPTLPPMRARDDADYADKPYPPRELRVLAGIRAWAVLAYFNPHKRLVPDWDAALRDALPRLDAAVDRLAYVRALRELGVRARDGHVGVWANDGVGAKPRAALGIHLRIVEGKVAVAHVLDAPGVFVGDVVEAIDGRPIADALAESRATTSGSTADARDQRAAAMLAFGDDGSVVKLSLRRDDGKLYEVALARRAANASPAPVGPHWKKLDGNVGYVDLRSLVVPEIEPMLAELAATRAIVFDMRGYPNGVAWTLAPRLNVKHAANGAMFDAPIVVGASEFPSTTHFIQPIPPAPSGTAIYTGKVVVLIDDRAISQAEHTCLFLREAAGATFVGSPTAGADGGITMLRLPGGLRMSFTGIEVRFVDGTQLQQVGVQPDVVARPTLAGLRAGKDEVLDRALAWLKAQR
jgi:C-terminal processing protease CtpA/Prc